MKAFKFFDLNNSGGVEPDEFAKAIEKIGIMIPTKQVSISLNFLCIFCDSFTCLRARLRRLRFVLPKLATVPVPHITF